MRRTGRPACAAGAVSGPRRPSAARSRRPGTRGTGSVRRPRAARRRARPASTRTSIRTAACGRRSRSCARSAGSARGAGRNGRRRRNRSWRRRESGKAGVKSPYATSIARRTDFARRPSGRGCPRRTRPNEPGDTSRRRMRNGRRAIAGGPRRDTAHLRRRCSGPSKNPMLRCATPVQFAVFQRSQPEPPPCPSPSTSRRSPPR